MDLRVRELMDCYPATILQNEPIKKMVELIEEGKRVIVTNEFRAPVGVIPAINTFKLLDPTFLNKPIKTAMEKKFSSIFPDELIGTHMENQEIWPVVENDKLIGALYRETLRNYWKNDDEGIKHYGMIIVDKGGKIRFFNKLAEQITGIKSYRAIGAAITDIYPQTKVFKNDQPQCKVEIILQDRIILLNKKDILSKGKIINILAVFLDISEQEYLFYYIQLVNELKSVIDSCADGICISDGEGVCKGINKAYESMTGLTNSMVRGKNIVDAIKKGYINDSVTLKVLKSRKGMTIKQQINRNKDVIVTGNPIIDCTGNISGVVTTVRDVTEINLLQEEISEINEKSKKYYSELITLREQILKKNDVIAESKSMKNVVEMCLRVAKFESTCLILGESGVGKDVVARLIHSSSPRKKHPFIKLNCAAIPRNLIEAELFGYDRGAFTGACKEGKPGMFELADKGTIFLDEIGEMPIELQAKLLQVIQDMKLIRIGGTKSVEINVRIIAATNRNIENMVKSGKFRKDLYYRLNIIPIEILPLHERTEEILPLIKLYLNQINTKYGKNSCFSPEVLERFLNYNWPGNVRELKNIVERMVVVSTGEVIGVEFLPKKILEAEKKDLIEHVSSNKLREAVEELEKHMITEAINKHKSLRKAAKVLDVNESTISRKVRKYSIGF